MRNQKRSHQICALEIALCEALICKESEAQLAFGRTLAFEHEVMLPRAPAKGTAKELGRNSKGHGRWEEQASMSVDESISMCVK